MEHTTVGHARDVAQSVEAFVLLLLQVSTLFYHIWYIEYAINRITNYPKCHGN